MPKAPFVRCDIDAGDVEKILQLNVRVKYIHFNKFLFKQIKNVNRNSYDIGIFL